MPDDDEPDTEWRAADAAADAADAAYLAESEAVRNPTVAAHRRAAAANAKAAEAYAHARHEANRRADTLAASERKAIEARKRKHAGRQPWEPRRARQRVP